MESSSITLSVSSRIAMFNTVMSLTSPQEKPLWTYIEVVYRRPSIRYGMHPKHPFQNST